MIGRREKGLSGSGTDGSDGLEEGHASTYRGWRSKQVWGESGRRTHATYKTKNAEASWRPRVCFQKS